MSDLKTCESFDLVERLYWLANNQPDRLAYRFLEDSRGSVAESGQRLLTYRALLQQVESVASVLTDHLAGSLLERESFGNQHAGNNQPVVNARVVLAFPPGLDFVASFFACLLLGVTAVPIPPPGRRHMQRFIDVILDTRPVALLTLESQLNTVNEGLAQLEQQTGQRVGQQIGEIAVLPVDTAVASTGVAKYRRADGQSIAFLQYTSGSTGTPKGVMVSHANLLDNLQRIRDCFGHDENSRGVIWLPPYHDMGLIGGILQPLYAGFPVTLMAPASFLRSPLRWLQAIEHFGATTSGGPNFAFQHCIERITQQDRANLDLSSWKVAFTGAEVVRARTLKSFAEIFSACGFKASAWLPCFGMAETTLLVTGNRLNTNVTKLSIDRKALEQSLIVKVDEGAVGAYTRVGNGAVADDHEICIVDADSLQPCNDDRVGEIWLRGPSVALGYWGRETETAETFSAYTADNEKAWLRTGDLGFIYEGELFISGRLKDLVIIRGRNLYPHDLERCIEDSHDLMASNATAAFTVDIDDEERLIIIHQPPRRVAEDVLNIMMTAIRSALSEEFEVAAHAIVMLKPGHLPLTPSGKVQRRRCRQQFLDNGLKYVAQWHAIDSAKNMAAVDNVTRVAGQTLADQVLADQVLDAKQVERWLCQWLAQRLQCSLADIDINRPLADFGLDSLAAVDLAAGLSMLTAKKAEFKEDFSETIAWQYPTVSVLARYVAGEDLGEASGKKYVKQAEHTASENTVLNVTSKNTTPGEGIDSSVDAAAMLTAELERVQRRNR